MSKLEEKRNYSEKKSHKEKKTFPTSQSKKPKYKSLDTMTIKANDSIGKELKEKGKHKKLKIFNNKGNIGKCSNLLQITKEQEKELILIPYAKEKQKVNKTLNTIGNANGIFYPTYSIIKGANKDKNYFAIIRDNGKKRNKNKKNKLLNRIKKENRIEINLDKIS